MLGYSLFLIFFLSNFKVKEVNGWNKLDSQNTKRYMLSTFKGTLHEDIGQYLRQKKDLKSEIADLEKQLNEAINESKVIEKGLTLLYKNGNHTKNKITDLKNKSQPNNQEIKQQEDLLNNTKQAIARDEEELKKAKEKIQQLEKQIQEKQNQLNPPTSTAKSPAGPNQPAAPGKPEDKKPQTEEKVPSNTPTTSTIWNNVMQYKMHCLSQLMETFQGLALAISKKLQNDIECLKAMFGKKT